MGVLQYSNGVNNGYHETRAMPSHCCESLTLCYGGGQGYRLLNYTCTTTSCTFQPVTEEPTSLLLLSLIELC